VVGRLLLAAILPALPVRLGATPLAANAAPQRMVIILMGPPGSGKSTQSEFLTRKYGLPAISSSALLREEIAANSTRGKELKTLMASGELVSDEIMNDLVRRRVSRPDARNGFILDGFPRTSGQARFLDDLVKQRGLPPPVLINLEVPEDEVIRRLSARGRPDDKPDVIRERLAEYHKASEPVLTWYKSGNLHRIDGTKSPEDVSRAIDAALAAGRK
jgi:adenylate kinase